MCPVEVSSAGHFHVYLYGAFSAKLRGYLCGDSWMSVVFDNVHLQSPQDHKGCGIKRCAAAESSLPIVRNKLFVIPTFSAPAGPVIFSFTTNRLRTTDYDQPITTNLIPERSPAPRRLKEVRAQAPPPPERLRHRRLHDDFEFAVTMSRRRNTPFAGLELCQTQNLTVKKATLESFNSTGGL